MGRDKRVASLRDRLKVHQAMNITLNNTKLNPPEGTAAGQDLQSAAAAAPQVATSAATPAISPAVLVPAAALPITHQSHPFWSGFSWPVFLHALQIAAMIAPTVVAVADKDDPAAIQTATQLSGIAGTLAGALLNPQQ